MSKNMQSHENLRQREAQLPRVSMVEHYPNKNKTTPKHDDLSQQRVT